jgi:hypothetical protein
MDEREFTIALEKFEADTLGKLDVILRKIALDLLSSVVAGIPYGVGTPVDTGRARGGWQVGVDNDPLGDTGRLDPSGRETIAAANNELGLVNAESVVYISNNVEYIGELEKGHSQQAPYGMLGVAVGAFSYIVEKRAEEIEAEVGGKVA